MTKLAMDISVLILKKECKHEQKHDDIAETPCYNKNRQSDTTMKNHLNIFVSVIFVLLLIPTSQYLIYAQRQKSNGSSPFDLPVSKSVLKNATSSSNIQGKYTANEINEIISNLYDDLRSDNTTEQHLHHNIGILLFVCGDKKNENATPACDISTEIQTD